MPQPQPLTMKTLSEQLRALIDDNKLRFFLQHEQIMALRHDRDYLRESVSSLSQCLADQLKINDAIGARVDQMADQVQTLTQLAAQQAEVIANLTSKLEELAKSHNSTADEVEMFHQRLNHAMKREGQTYTLSESNANRLELHGSWISDLFNRLNDHVNEE